MKRENETEAKSTEIMDENFPKLMEKNNPLIQEIQ